MPAAFRTIGIGLRVAVFSASMFIERDQEIGVGHDIGPYRIEALIGAGGMGVVYRAHDRGLRRTVAIKMVDRRAGIDAKSWLLREAQLAAALSHPSICAIHEVGEIGDQPYIVMAHVEGRPLSAMIPTGKGFALGTALHYAMQITDAVAHAHRHGIVHRDLKSSNVLIAPDGHATLLDFGLAIRSGDGESNPVETTCARDIPSGAGTVPYMAPELLRGRRATPRSDVWALGVLIFELVTGRRPFDGATRWELAASILADPPLLPPRELPAGWRRVIERSLMKNPADRFRAAGALMAALDDLP
ncbi:MAG TPA: serine/threonine-protein kinase [Vicinamibacterales bacterium]|nr:serine/threonine-protein kinase [Vicinamibacterales bacterium]